MYGENQLLVTDERISFEKISVEVQDLRRKLTDYFRGIYAIYLKFRK